MKPLTFAERSGKVGIEFPAPAGARKKPQFEPYSLADALANLHANTYSEAFRRIHPDLVLHADTIHDILCNQLRGKGPSTAPELLSYLQKAPGIKMLPQWLPDVCIRSAVAEGRFERHGNNKSQPQFRLSKKQLEKEKHREFAGTFASELSALSERIRLLIGHPTEVGSYREGLLQNLLRKHLPERYHVATGFIHNCEKQIDILIYDRIEYPPLFREGDMVVVAPEAVRAAIEVKTKLDGKELTDSLKAMDLVSPHDDCDPPFFKGIFAYETSLVDDTLEGHIVDYYNTSGTHPIRYPYRHLTSLCVLGTTYMEVVYHRGKSDSRFIPRLRKYRSETGQPIQATLFLDALLTYLRTRAIKTVPHRQLARLLRTDSRWRNGKPLADPAWGPYAGLATGDSFAKIAKEEMEGQIVKIGEWLRGDQVYD